jgi:hypothetical protein
MAQPVAAALGGKVISKAVGRRVGRVARAVDVETADDLRIKDEVCGFGGHGVEASLCVLIRLV